MKCSTLARAACAKAGKPQVVAEVIDGIVGLTSFLVRGHKWRMAKG